MNKTFFYFLLGGGHWTEILTLRWTLSIISNQSLGFLCIIVQYLGMHDWVCHKHGGELS